MSIGKLHSSQGGPKELIFTREFNAPQYLVVEAYTKPEYIRRWLLGPPGWEMPVCDMDIRPGGKYRWEWLKSDGKASMGLGGEFLEVALPNRLVMTQAFDDGWDGKQTTITVDFLPSGEKTVLRLTIQYESEQALATAMQSPMETGMETSYERVDDLLNQMQDGGK